MKRKQSLFLYMIAVIISLVLSGCPEPDNQPAETEGHGSKVLLIGIDALTFNALDPLIEAGRVPNLEKLVTEGMSAILRSIPPTRSPVIWTSIATGKTREEHGITSFLSDGPLMGGGEQPFLSSDRKVAALWNMMGMQNRTVGCFGWWVTWPAEEVNGVMVSSFTSLGSEALVQRGLDMGEGWEHLTWPEDLKDEISDWIVPIDTVSREEMERFVNIDDWEHPLLEFRGFERGVNYVLPWSYATDLTYSRITENLMDRDNYDLTMVYLQSCDALAHRFWVARDDFEYLDENMAHYDLPPEYAEVIHKYFGDTVNRAYEFVDELVGNLLSHIDDDTVVIICSDHGFGVVEEPWEDSESVMGHVPNHVDDGVIILWGPGIRHGKRLSAEQPPVIYDVAPTVLTIMGLPVAGDFAGKPIMDAFDARFMQDFHPELVESYDVDFEAGEAPVVIPLSEEYEERLRSLGYIQ